MNKSLFDVIEKGVKFFGWTDVTASQCLLLLNDVTCYNFLFAWENIWQTEVNSKKWEHET